MQFRSAVGRDIQIRSYFVAGRDTQDCK